MKFDIGKLFMAFIIVLIAVLMLAVGSVLTGCEPRQGPPLETECKFSEPISVNVVELDEKQMREKWEYYNRQKLPEGAIVKGFAIHNRTTGLHTLFVLRIRGQNDHDRIETIGHELMHSFCGDWHPRNVG